jgi:hypothetical protein
LEKRRRKLPLRLSDPIIEKSLKPLLLFEAGFQEAGGAKLHLGDAGMRGYDFPAVIKFWRFMVAISHHSST